ncbi:MAG: DinB family protein [Fimbriimonadaceae bacterium]|nr:DinB family protein [Fimbriimonadaceae bacterium]
MQAETLSPARQMVAQAQQNAQMGKGFFLATLAGTPDDRLTWTPAETARAPLQLAGHVAWSNRAFAGILRDKVEQTTWEEINQATRDFEATIVSREQAVREVEASTQEVMDALNDLSDERVFGMAELPMMTAPIQFFMFLPGLHMNNHASQMDYIQTIYGDMEWHTPQM